MKTRPAIVAAIAALAVSAIAISGFASGDQRTSPVHAPMFCSLAAIGSRHPPNFFAISSAC
jgi:hypothetical protein